MRRIFARRVTGVALGLALLTIALGVVPVAAAGIVVNSLSDVAADDGACTLREAISAANTNTGSGATAGECAAGAGADTITFSVTGTITLTAALPNITTDVTIDGGGAITIDGANAYRPIYTTTSTTTVLSGLKITHGRVASYGGAVQNNGTMTIVDSTISANAATAGYSGGVATFGNLTILRSTFTGNASTIGYSGALGTFAFVDPVTVTISDSTFNANSAAVSGSAIFASNFGAAVSLAISNSTFWGNSGGSLGGGAVIFSSVSAFSLTNVTFAGNGAAPTFTSGSGSSSATNVLAVGNASDTLNGFPSSTNLIGVPSGKTLADIVVVDGGGLPVLAANGGPTKTVALALVAGNPAIDTGSSATCAAAPVSGKDQRGKTRPTACDIGAYEAQPPTVAAHADVTGTPTSASGGTVTYTAPAGTDEQGGALTTSCLPASGSTFPVGSTTVTCTATDAVGHTGTGTFQVVLGALVTAAPTVQPTLCECDTSSLVSDRSETPGLPVVLAVLGVLAAIALRPIRTRGRRKE